jgi:hypothetical protein
VKLLKREELSTAQESAVNFLQAMRRGSLWAKPGSGKTVVAATAISELFEGPTLVVATKRIVELVWRQELEIWEHLAHLEAVLLTGSPKAREALLATPADFYLINYELLPWLADVLAGSPWPFRSIVFDEVSKMKWPNTRRFKKLRGPVKAVPVRFGLTGTPRGNAIMGVWGQTYMTSATAKSTPLAPSMAHFKAQWFHTVDKERRIWRPNKGAEEDIRSEAAKYAHSMPRSTASPEAKVVPVAVAMPAAVRRTYAALEADLCVEIGGHMIEAPEAGTVRGKLLQICSGAIYTDRTRAEWVPVHEAKIEAFNEIVEEMQGEPLLVFYRFRHELERMRKARPGLLGIDDTDHWLKHGGELVVHPESAAHGLNLHVGGCSTSVWFTLPDSQELWEQGNRRLARKGQTEDVTALVLAIRNTIEDNVSRNLAAHGRLQDELIDAAT